MAFFTASYHQLLWSPTPLGVPRAPSAGVWLSLPHLVFNSSFLQLSDFLSWPSYIIVHRPLNRPLNLWNGMFGRHQAEITVMQFRGHSLPVHQSMSVSWAFYLVPFRQPNPFSASLWVEGQNTTEAGVNFVVNNLSEVVGSKLESNGNERVLHIPQIAKIWVSLSDAI